MARHRPARARLAPAVPVCPAPPVWVHACSVGELSAAAPLLQALQQRYPDVPRVLTTNTPDGYRKAEGLRELAALTWNPVDVAPVVGRFYRALQPRAVVLVEGDLWPNMLAGAHRRGVPVAIVSARRSDKRRYRAPGVRGFLRQLLAPVALVAAQTDADAERYAQLGVPADRIHTGGNLKFDAVRVEADRQARDRLRRHFDIPPSSPVLVFGSTRPGEEALAAQVYAALADAFPALHMMVAPRHPQRTREALHALPEGVQRYSAPNPRGAHARLILLDELGLLVPAYALAQAAMVGGSFFPGYGGHNILEPAALGVPTLFGPHMSAYRDVAAAMCKSEGAWQCRTADELIGVLTRLLRAPGEARRAGTRVRNVVLRGQGATARTLGLLAPVLDPSA